MSKGKVSVERNTAAKDATRRPSIPSIQTRVTAISQRRRSRSGKSPLPEANLNQGTMTKLSKTILATGDNGTGPPKTSFNSHDKSKELRSSSSPRLKSFPAERIRKFDSPTLFDNKPIMIMANQNSERSDALFVPTSSIPNHEHGDHVRGMNNGHQHQSQSAENTCQQQICTMHHQSIPQSDGAVTYRVHGPDRHRPNVPHGHQSYVNPMTASTTLAYVHNGQTPVARSSTPITLVHPQQSLRNSNEMTNVQKENNWVQDELPKVVDLEKQPVGGRNLMLYRQAVMQERQQQQQQQQQQQLLQTRSHPAMYSNDHSISVSPSHNLNSSQTNSNPIVTRENPQQIYQQLQNNLTNQQQMQQRAINQQFQMMSGQQQRQHPSNVNQGAYYNYFAQPMAEKMTGSYGMTSPQDANINQTRNIQNAMISMQQKQQLINQQNKITPNSQMSIDNPNINSQIKPYTINLVDNNKSQNVTYNHHHGQIPQLYRPPIPGQQFVNYYQQNMIPPNDVPQQIITNEVPTNLEKRNLKFTPKMIRDQELLVATMKQQRISDELMRRQFDNLLREQRRQLEYLEQFRQEGGTLDTKKQETRKKIQMDEKPEWMAHITPPHIPYSDLEKLNTKVQEGNVITSQQQVNENYPDDYNKIQQNRNNLDMVQSTHDQSQQKVHQLWQQQNVNWQQRMGFPTIGTGIPQYDSSQTHLLKSMSVPPQQYQQHFLNNPMPPQYSYWQYPQQMQQPYQQQYYQTPQQVTWQNDQSQNEKNSRLSKKAISLNDLNIRNVEPSSLLKLRLYKEVIRPQKRNNGLQDPETIQKALEILNNPESHVGLEYLANLNRKKPKIKLNGIQDPNEITPDLISKPPGFDNSNSIARKGVSANGLENSRNPNNPFPQPLTHLKRSEIRTNWNEYPKQKQNNPRNRYSLMAEREDGTVAPTVQYQMLTPDQQFNNHHQQHQNYQKLIPYNDKNSLSVLNKPMSYQFDSSVHPDYYQQMQHFYQNKQNLIRNNGQGDVPSLNKPNTANIAYLDSPGGDTADLSYSKENGQIQNKIAPYAPFGLTQRLNGNYNSTDIREAKTIGGVTYLARKSEYIPNQPIISGNIPTANKYVQPSIIYH
ncbi:putative uncharacterized protein DDB_G0271606 [Polistes fuscatus]|uniref:putative uncharacterized protein DDB_G0271606 n=1 Tax=Polistes fuscatus TaxID=30207 RepID=UPI001CA824C6|nr:putative uncharacterized protein DDB_G0271606 [Polistes fuscatus]